jgi:hypothetical protein
VAVESAAPVRCPDRVHRIKNRAVRLVPRVQDFLKKTTSSGTLTLPSLGNEDKVAAAGEAGRVRMRRDVVSL